MSKAVPQTMTSATAQPMIPLSEPYLAGNAWHYIKDALDSGWVSSVGPYVDRFEQEMAAFIGVPRTVSTVNGTAALHTALIIAGIGPGDEVIVPSMTFVSTYNTIRYVGATPVFWDSLADHWNADVNQLAHLMTPNTRAVMPVHLYGHPVPMGPVLEAVQRAEAQYGHKIWVIEDTAEAIGAEWQGQHCGTFGDMGTLSFNGNKMLTTGGGGLLFSQDPQWMERAHYLINQAKDDALTFRHDEIGYNYRQTNLLAALGVAQLELLPEMMAKRQAIFDRYTEGLKAHPALHCFASPEESVISPWLYNIALRPEVVGPRTGLELIHAMAGKGIQTRPLFRPGHTQKQFVQFSKTPCPWAERWFQYGISLPSSTQLTRAEQGQVMDAILQTLDDWS